jgi:hypothetical protein
VSKGYLYRASHPAQTFEVIRLIGRSKKGAYHLEIMTPSGPVTAWISQRRMDYYVYHCGGRIVREAVIEEWLAKKIGLIADGS